MELTNNLRKLVASLSERKIRKREGLFKAEGTKCVADTLGHFDLYVLFATEEWIESNKELSVIERDKIIRCRRGDIERMTSLSTPSDVIAVYRIPEYDSRISVADNTLMIALDDIQDPGNLGTIMRTADWFGITDILCSPATADCYNPKVVQATMGAISRVRMHYCDLSKTLSALSGKLPVYGTFLEGENIYTSDLTPAGIIVMGNEGRGVSQEIAGLIGNRISIPSGNNGENGRSESLNVAIATAITLSEFFRRNF